MLFARHRLSRHRWRPDDPDNPYAAFLGLADEIIVTGDSASMLADACVTGRPVRYVALPHPKPDRADPGSFLLKLIGRPRGHIGERGTPRQQDNLGRRMDKLIAGGVVRPPRDLALLHEALRWRGLAPQPGGTMAVIGPGTGLGVAGVVQTPRAWLALPGEGGHATLSAADDFESALLAWVRGRHEHVSAERLLSGIGLPLLHQALAAVNGEPADELSAQDIVERGLADAGGLCGRTLDAFCALLGSFAGNVALTLGARGGVYIGGGIVPRLGERFFDSRFRERFEAKGRFRSYLAGIPTVLITDTLVALEGAAVAVAQNLR